MMTAPLPQLRLLLALQLGTGLVFGALLTAFYGVQPGASFGFGVLIMLINLIGLAWAWWRVLTQKTIAWTVLIIVIKYAVLLGAIFHFAREPWFQVLPAGLGVASFVMAALLTAVLWREKEKI